MVQLVQDALPDGKPRALGNFVTTVGFRGCNQEGDLVVLPRKHVADRYWPGHGAGSIRHEHGFTHGPCEWVRPDIPRATFEQDLYYSFGAFMAATLAE